MTRLATLFNLRPGEGRLVTLLVALMLATAIGNSIGVSGIEALFFARFGVAYLPLIYMIQGLLTLVVTLSVSAVLGGRSRNIIYMLLPLVMAAVLIAERFLAGLTWFLPIMWLLKEVMNSLMGLYVWGVASALCDTRQAKRLFPLFNAGRIFGSVLGGLGTGLLVSLIGAENLLIVWAVTLGLAFLVTRALLGQSGGLAPQMLARGRTRSSRKARTPGFIHEVQQGYQFVRGSALMRWVSVAAVLFSALYFSLALPFSKAAAENFVSEDRIAGFLGLFNGLSTAAAFLASLFLANRLYTRFGIMTSILALPIIYLLGFGVLAAFAAFPVLMVYKFVQMLWLVGIADSAYQAMFNAVPSERRDQVRAFIGGVPEQAGTFIAGFILIVGEQTLQTQQLYIIGLALALACTYVIWQAGRAYSGALVAALKAGQPSLFIGTDSFRDIQCDATAVATVVGGIASPDPAIRRVSAEILGNLSAPKGIAALVDALADPDSQVRAASLRALERARATSALLEVAACLKDADPGVRAQAIETVRSLAGYRQGLIAHVAPLLEDPDSAVRARAAVALLKVGAQPEARGMLCSMAVLGEVDERVQALTALGEVGDAESFALVAMELEDTAAPSIVRRTAAKALAAYGLEAVPALVKGLTAEDRAVRDAVATALGQIGPPAVEPVLAALFQPETGHGAVHALDHLPLALASPTASEAIRRYARERMSEALKYHGWWGELNGQASDDRARLLVDSLRDKAQHEAVHTLRAIHVLSDRETIAAALENLQSRDPTQRANALETLEAVKEKSLLRPLLKVWEMNSEAASGQVDGARTRILESTLEDNDAWIRACSVLVAGIGDRPGLTPKLSQLALSDPDPVVRAEAQKALNGGSMDTLATLSLMERILFLRRVPLFADLSPADLKQVAAIASEQLFGDGELLAQQGEIGNEMFVIASGEVRVLIGEEGKSDAEVARRQAGDVVGEMAIISQEPRIASLAAAGEVRTLCIDQKSFEGLLRERPETSLAVMRVLCVRLKEASRQTSWQAPRER